MVRVNSEKTVVGVVTDAATGDGAEALVERDSDGFMEWLGDFARDCGVEAMVTDDLNTYKPVVERLGIDHQICIARVRKRARNRLDRIDEWDWINWICRIWSRRNFAPPAGGVCVLRNPPKNDQPFLGRLRGKWLVARTC